MIDRPIFIAMHLQIGETSSIAMLVVQHLVFLLCVVVPRADFALSRDVRATLTQLRLSQYASAFEDAEIVAGDLPLLSEESRLPKGSEVRPARNES